MTELTDEECWEVLEAGRVAHVGLIDQGEPYVTPLSYVVKGRELLFRGAPGRRAGALEANPRVCVEVTVLEESGSWRSVVLWGDARLIDDPAVHADVVTALLAKYPVETAPGFSSPAAYPQERHVVAVIPRLTTGRSSDGGDDIPATRPGRL